MANAPTPGRTNKAKRQGYRVTLYGQVHELLMDDIGPGDEALVRQVTGRPLTAYLNASGFGLDSIGVIVWIARRKAGERKLQLGKVYETLPTYGEWNDLIEAGQADFEQLDDIDDEDEGDGVIDVDEVDTHPLPPAGA